MIIEELLGNLMMIATIVSILIYLDFSSFDWKAFILALFLSVLTLFLNGKIVKILRKNPSIVYYSIILIATLFFSIDECKCNTNMILLLLSNVLVSFLAFLTHTYFSFVLFVFMNFYTILNFIFYFIDLKG